MRPIPSTGPLPEPFRHLFMPGGPLERYDALTLEQDPAVIYALDAAGRIFYCNAGWDAFQRENGGRSLDRLSVLGLCVFGTMPEVLAGFYRKHYERVMATGEEWEFDFECSSAEHYRTMRMRTRALKSGGGLMVTSAAIIDRPHQRAEGGRILPGPGIALISMCAGCRRVRVSEGREEQWEWIREAVRAAPENVSHGLCPLCCEHYYGRDAARLSEES